MAYSYLISPDPFEGRTFVGDLATSWDLSKDGRVYTFHLRRDAKFTDGVPVTAEDVVLSYQRMIFPPSGVLSPRQALFAYVDKVEAPDQYTVQFTLKRPWATFLDVVALGWNVIYPKHVLAEKGDMKQTVLGSGPFKLKKLVAGVSIEHEKNPDYYVKGLPYLDGYKHFIIKDPTTIEAALKTGQLDMANRAQHSLDPPIVVKLGKEHPDFRVYWSKGGAFASIIFNFKRPPWNDLRVRKAVRLAVSHQEVIEIAEFGISGRIGGYVGPDTIFARPDEYWLDKPGFRADKSQDLPEAKRLLAEAGFPQGLSVIIPMRNTSYQVNPSVVIKDQLAKIGIKMTLQPTEAGAHRLLLLNHDFDVIIHFDGLTLADPDIGFREVFATGSPKNYGFYSNPEVDRLLDEQSMEVDVAKRKALVNRMEDLALNDVPRVSYWWLSDTIVGPRVRNYVQPQAGGYPGSNRIANWWLVR